MYIVDNMYEFKKATDPHPKPYHTINQRSSEFHTRVFHSHKHLPRSSQVIVQSTQQHEPHSSTKCSTCYCSSSGGNGSFFSQQDVSTKQDTAARRVNTRRPGCIQLKCRRGSILKVSSLNRPMRKTFANTLIFQCDVIRQEKNHGGCEGPEAVESIFC